MSAILNVATDLQTRQTVWIDNSTGEHLSAVESAARGRESVPPPKPSDKWRQFP